MKKRGLTDLLAQALPDKRRVDTDIPARENMAVFQDAVKLTTTSGKWQKHPNRKRKNQEIQLVTGLARYGKATGRKRMSPSMPV